MPETRSRPDDPRAKELAGKLFSQYVPQQMEAPLPPPLKDDVAKARANYIAYVAEQKLNPVIQALKDLGYGHGPF